MKNVINNSGDYWGRSSSSVSVLAQTLHSYFPEGSHSNNLFLGWWMSLMIRFILSLHWLVWTPLRFDSAVLEICSVHRITPFRVDLSREVESSHQAKMLLVMADCIAVQRIRTLHRSGHQPHFHVREGSHLSMVLMPNASIVWWQKEVWRYSLQYHQ